MSPAGPEQDPCRGDEGAGVRRPARPLLRDGQRCASTAAPAATGRTLRCLPALSPGLTGPTLKGGTNPKKENAAMATTGSSKVRYAVVGAGNIAQVAVLPAFAHAGESSELVAIVSSDEAKRRELGQRYRVSLTAGYQDFERVLASDEIDAVYIALPNHMHREYTERAARQGVHVLCEKPMATSVEDCEAMIEVCAENDVKLMIAYRLHFEEANLRAVEVARSGRIGDPLALGAWLTQQVRPGDIRTRDDAGGGALFDEGPYPVNAARYLFQDEPVEVFAFSNVDQDPRFRGVDGTTSALLRFPDGRVAHFCVSQAAAPVSGYRLVGSRGDLVVDGAFDYVGERKHVLTVEGKSEEKTFPRSDQFAPELIYFSRCVLANEDPEPDGQEGLADVRVLLALQESASTGRSVKLPPLTRTRRPEIGQLITKPPVDAPDPVHAPSPSQS
jgi:predicted dehydrogenase